MLQEENANWLPDAIGVTNNARTGAIARTGHAHYK